MWPPDLPFASPLLLTQPLRLGPGHSRRSWNMGSPQDSIWPGVWMDSCALRIPYWSAGGAPAPRNPFMQARGGGGEPLETRSAARPVQPVGLVWVWTAGAEVGVGVEARRCVLRRRGCAGFAHALGMCVRCGRVAGLGWLWRCPGALAAPPRPRDPAVGFQGLRGKSGLGPATLLTISQGSRRPRPHPTWGNFSFLWRVGFEVLYTLCHLGSHLP